MSITAILAYLATSVFGVAELPERWETLINAAAPVIAGYLWPDRADAGSPGNDGGPQQNPRGGIETPPRVSGASPLVGSLIFRPLIGGSQHLGIIPQMLRGAVG
jgi:hypothetical protein